MSAPNSDGLNNRFNSYQNGSPPGQTFADQQTGVLSDTVKTHYQAEASANAVMTQLATQRQQLQGANDNVHDMRQATEETRQNLQDLRSKYQQKKNKLYRLIAFMALLDLALFVRILQCHGSFICWR
mmetsp:Transcript_7211/g.19550  ORF Transcript_7211/g.19550 Transcript_7211/m.19550 type:complete len:127 (-) Transcript_7211:463-843(-)